MNPVFVFLIILALVSSWFLLSFLYKPLGWLCDKIWKDTLKEINNDEEKGDM